MATNFSGNESAASPRRSLGKQISYIARAIRWILDRELDQPGLSTATYMFVRVVSRTPGITQNELSDETQLDKATTAKGVAKLESLGYLTRVADRADGRVRHLYLTDSGERLIPSIHTALRRVTEICAADLTEAELDQLFGLLDRVEGAVSAYLSDAKGTHLES